VDIGTAVRYTGCVLVMSSTLYHGASSTLRKSTASLGIVKILIIPYKGDASDPQGTVGTPNTSRSLNASLTTASHIFASQSPCTHNANNSLDSLNIKMSRETAAKVAFALIRLAFEVSAAMLEHAGIFMVAFKLYTPLSRCLLPPSPEKVQQREQLSKEELFNPFDWIPAIDYWQFMRAIMVALHLIRVYPVRLHYNTEGWPGKEQRLRHAAWRISLEVMVMFSFAALALIRIKQAAQLWDQDHNLSSVHIASVPTSLRRYYRAAAAALSAGRMELSKEAQAHHSLGEASRSVATPDSTRPTASSGRDEKTDIASDDQHAKIAQIIRRFHATGGPTGFEDIVDSVVEKNREALGIVRHQSRLRTDRQGDRVSRDQSPY